MLASEWPNLAQSMPPAAMMFLSHAYFTGFGVFFGENELGTVAAFFIE